MSRDPLDPTSNSQSSGRSNRDLIAVGLYAVLATVALVVGSGLPPAIRVPVALPLLLFAPGYAVVTALLPASRDPSSTPGSAPADGLGRAPRGAHDGLSRLERFTLALVTSVAIVPTVALVASVLVGVALAPVLVGVVVVTLLAAILAATRRSGRGAAGSRPTGGAGGDAGAISAPSDLFPSDAVTLAAVAIAGLLLATSAAVAFSGTGQDAGTTALSVGSESGGEFVADGYPETLEPGEPATVDVAIEHGGDESREYEVIAALDAVEYADAATVGNDSAAERSTDDGTTVTATTELDRYATTVEPDERSIDAVELDPAAGDDLGAAEGDDRRVSILLYEGEAPDEPDHESAHRVVSLPVEVADSPQ